MTNEQVYAMSFGKLYPLLAGKALAQGVKSFTFCSKKQAPWSCAF